MTARRRNILFAAGAVILALMAYGYFIEPQMLLVNRYDVAVPGWQSAFDGLKIVAIADVHGGSNGADAEKLRSIVQKANAEDADMIVLLGDYVSASRGHTVKMEPEDVAESLRGLKAKYGVYVVLGNHDNWYDGPRVAVAFVNIGYRVLDGSVATIERDGKRLRILGLKDHQQIVYWRNYADDAKRLLAETEGTGDVLVLQHSPDIVPVITGQYEISKDVKLVLSGHTHGGQISLPIVGPPIIPSSYGQKYARGQVRQEGIEIFITTGIGTSILPFRFGVPPEIAVLTVKSDSR